MHDTKGRKMHDFLHWLRNKVNNQIPLTPSAYENIHQTVVSEGEKRIRIEMSLEINQILAEG